MKTCAFVVVLISSFLLITTEATIQNYKKNVTTRILGGTRAKIGQFPWHVVILTTNQLNKHYICGGSLIDHEWVLTAAHCMNGVKEVTLQFGGVTLDTSEIVTEELMHIVHPKYNMEKANNDIALIRLPYSITYSSTIQPIALPSVNDRIGPKVSVTVSGYGRISEYISGNRILYYTNLTTVDNTECAKIYGEDVVVPSTLCVRGGPKRNTCSGDSGGPLVRYDEKGVATQVGIVSFVNGFGCGEDTPSGYVRTASFIDWIHDTIKAK